MARLWLSLIGVAMCSFLLLSLGGCPDGSSLNGVLDNLNADLEDLTSDPQGLAEDEGVVLGALEVAVEDDEEGLADEPTDEEPYFGEDASLYADVDSDAAVLDEGDVLGDEGPPESGQRFVLAQGTLAGRFWNDDPNSTVDDSSGVFRGRWFSSNGAVRGYLRGHYEPLAAADVPYGLAAAGVFRGKYIDAEGQFLGFLRGKFGRTENGRRMFVGREFDADKQHVGLMKGHWGDPLENLWSDTTGAVISATAREQDQGGGLFAGRWVVFNVCDENDSLPDYEFDPDDFGGYGATAEVLTDADLEDVDDSGEPMQEASGERDSDVALCIDPDGAFGFLAGWYTGPDENTDSTDYRAGLFRGRWRAADRTSHGVLIGRFEEVDPAGYDGGTAQGSPGSDGADSSPTGREAMVLGVFYGKYVDTTGAVRGFIRGAFGRSRNGMSVFRGEYFDASGAEAGVLFGRYNPNFHIDGRMFHGVWNGQSLEEESVE